MQSEQRVSCKYTDPSLQCHDKGNPQGFKHFLPRKIKDVMFLFLYHVLGLHFKEANKQQQ